QLLDFIGQGFDGGTDLQAPLERVVELVAREGWRSADLLLVSDGEFGCTETMLQTLDAAKRDLGLRVQGVLVGDRETLGLLETCDDIFWLREWRRFEGHAPQRAGHVPVHTASLTAIYFPGALSERAARMAARRIGEA
ncbi:MAG TPA: VWA domain-containing protein, partial [Burkholderiaceae bacterium]|nr:VWA domain-containing protein [Burkholderiaceae bacterium]